METKQQAGIGIFLALTTAVCWGALPIAMKEVLETMAPFRGLPALKVEDLREIGW